MKVLALVLGILGGLSAAMGVVVALELVADFMMLTWMFWMVLGAILLMGSIAVNTGRSEFE